MRRAITIKEIAEQLNLSRNTVAKALNGQYVPEKTRELVLKKAREMNYKSLSASHFETGSKKYRILLVSGKPLNNINYFIPLLKGIENYCYERNFGFFQYTYNIKRTPFANFAEYVRELNPDGIVAVECFDKNFIAKLLNLGIPICFNDFTASDIPQNDNYDVITTNDEKSICDVVKLLYNKYRLKRFTFVGDHRHCLSFRNRFTGMLNGIEGVRGEHSGNEDILCNDESFDYGNAESIKTEILKLKYSPECYICGNDFIARNVCNALKGLKLSVPQNALVVGFDNVAEATAFAPEITSFSIDKEFLGRETMHVLVHRIENPDMPSRMITLNTTLILRKSTDR